MYTADQLVERALIRASEFGGSYPSARSPLYIRIGHRQRQLFVRAGVVNPERYGACASSALAAGLCDFTDIVAPVPTPESIQRVEVLDPGTSGYAIGTEINIVSVYDPDAELAPRAYIRSGVLIGVAADLAAVTSIKLFFARLPDLFTTADKDKLVEIEAPWDMLLEVDATIWLVQKATQMQDVVRQAAITLLTTEQTALLAEWDEHNRAYTPIISRFVPPRDATRELGQ